MFLRMFSEIHGMSKGLIWSTNGIFLGGSKISLQVYLHFLCVYRAIFLGFQVIEGENVPFVYFCYFLARGATSRHCFFQDPEVLSV